MRKYALWRACALASWRAKSAFQEKKYKIQMKGKKGKREVQLVLR